jgi:hypothetical protein
MTYQAVADCNNVNLSMCCTEYYIWKAYGIVEVQFQSLFTDTLKISLISNWTRLWLPLVPIEQEADVTQKVVRRGEERKIELGIDVNSSVP